jgi:signal transduction histidine kinase
VYRVKERRLSKIQRRLVGFLLVVALVPLAVVGSYGIFNTKRHLENFAKYRVTSSSTFNAMAIRAMLNTARSDVLSLAEPAARGILPEALRAGHFRGFSRFSVLDREGLEKERLVKVGETWRSEKGLRGYGGDPFVVEALGLPRYAVAEGLSLDGVPCLALCSGAGSGKLLLAVAGPSFIADAFAQKQKLETEKLPSAEVYLVSQSGDILYREVPAGAGGAQTEAKNVASLLPPGERSGLLAPLPSVIYSQKDWVYVSEPVLFSHPARRGGVKDHLSIVMRIPYGDLFRTVHFYNLILQSLLAVCTVLSIVLGIYLSRDFIRPIRALVKGTEEIAGGNLDYSLGLKTGDEFELLVDHFNGMAQKLKEIYDKIEMKVVERTRELAEANLRLEEANRRLEDANVRLSEMDRMKDEFVSMVSHELRTPMTSIGGSLSLVLDGTVGGINEDQQELLEIAKSNTTRLIRLINDILDISKIESGKMQMARDKVDMGRVIADSMEGIRSFADGYGVSITSDVEEGLPGIVGDRDRLVQVVTNLLSNAVKFSPKGGTVNVAARSGDGKVIIAVRDEGIGVPAEYLGRIFEKFQQVDSSSQREKGGTGLGLPICKAIVEEHGGLMGVESEPGKGSVFTFEIPLKSGEDSK